MQTVPEMLAFRRRLETALTIFEDPDGSTYPAPGVDQLGKPGRREDIGERLSAGLNEHARSAPAPPF